MKYLFSIILALTISPVYAHEYGDYVLNCVEIVNDKREARPFLSPYKPDPELQERAELIVLEMATLRHRGHLNRRQRGNEYNFYPIAKGEGVGYRGGQDHDGNGFITCFLYDRGYYYCGAAMAIGTDGWTYYCLLVR